MVEVPPIDTLAGSDEHEITGGRGASTVSFALQEATLFLPPSLKVAVIWYEPGFKPVVSICVDAPASPGFTPEPLQLYTTVRLGLKLDPTAVAVVGSPTITSVGLTEQLAETGGPGCSPPDIYTTPACSLTPLTSVAGTTDDGPY